MFCSVLLLIMAEVEDKFAVWFIISLILFISAVLFIVVRPIEQDKRYHNFASDGKQLSGCCVSNWKNVMSNIPFLIGNVMGIMILEFGDPVFQIEWEKDAWKIIFMSFMLVGFGSAYYHWKPNDNRLVWDRVPMTIGFMSFFSLTSQERIGNYFRTNFDLEIGKTIIIPMIVIGILDTVYSHIHNDLRGYILVGVILPTIITPMTIIYFDVGYTENQHQLYTCLWYLLAKLCEEYDKVIWKFSSQWISGHTLKHLVAGMIPFQLGYMLLTRSIA